MAENTKNEDVGCVFRSLNKDAIRVIWEITAKCNLNCSYCFRKVDLKEAELTLNEKFSLLDELKKNGVGRVVLTGGEPLISENIFKILSKLEQNDLDYKVLSNLSCKNILVRQLIGLKKLKMSISIDDSTKEGHNSNRGAGSFEKIIRNLGVIREITNDLSAICLVSKHNYKNVRNIVEFVLLNGFRTITFTNIINVDGGYGESLNKIYANDVLTEDGLKYFNKSVDGARREFSDIGIRTVGFVNQPKGCIDSGRSIIHISPGGCVNPCGLTRLNSRCSIFEAGSLRASISMMHEMIAEGNVCSYCQYY